jgi:hypothetical protein
MKIGERNKFAKGDHFDPKASNSCILFKVPQDNALYQISVCILPKKEIIH